MTRIPLLALSFLLLSSCQTLEGLGNDLDSAWNASADAFTRVTARDVTDERDALAKKAAGPAVSITCPTVKVMEELRRSVEFQDPAKPSDKTEISRATIKNVSARCSQGDDLAVELDITVDTALGPKARVKKTDKPHFVFPYFVAVVGPQGNVMAKEIFATSFAYENGEDTMAKTETITQYIPLGDGGTLPAYSILIGFQLSEEQLTFNRTQPVLSGSPAL